MDAEEYKLEISTEKLIEAVKKRPVLYSKGNPNFYTHGKFKGQLWKEVCREVLPDWTNLSPHRKVEYAHDIQRRWKNLRTCFTRELLQQKKDLKRRNSGAPFKKRKKYIYFDDLSFLINPEEVPDEGDVKVSMEDDSSDPLESEIFHLQNDESVYEEPKDQHYVEIDEEAYQPQSLQGEDTTRQMVTQMLADFRRNDVEDEDKQFVLSIVPTLRKLNEKQKFDAKIEILKVLKRISTGDDF